MGNNFLTPEAIVESLNGSFRDTLVLSNFSSECWKARVKDADAAKILAEHVSADPKVFRVSKYLFEGTKRHARLVGAIGHAYNVNKDMTKPFGKNGLRVMPNSAIGEYLVALDDENKLIEEALEDFIDNYDKDVATGMSNLGDLAQYAGGLYKPKGELRKHFSIRYDDPLPFPDRDGFGDMDENTLTRIQINLERSLRTRMAGTFSEALDDFAGALQAVEERLTDKLATFDEEAEEGKRKPMIKLTGAVLNTPVREARILRRFAHGEWADKMGRIESALESILLAKGLSKDAARVDKALQAVTAIRKGLQL